MAKKKAKSSRGFFFTVMALAMLSFMLLTVQVWVRTFEQYDIRAAQKFKGEAVRLALSTLSDRAVSKFANASAFFALHKLVNFTSAPGNGLLQKPGGDESDNPGTGRVPEVLLSLMLSGTANPLSDPQAINYTLAEKEAYTIASWQEKIRSAAEVMGFNASFSGLKNFSFGQDSPWSVKVYFEMEMNISDQERTMQQTKLLKANATFPIDGFLDPFIERLDAHQRCSDGLSCANYSQRQFFRNESYAVPYDISPSMLVPSPLYQAPEGNGWFFGPVTFDYPASISFEGIDKLSQYILVHNYDENLTSFADSYGAVILIGIPGERTYPHADPGACPYNVTEQTNCLNCWRRFTSNVLGCAPSRNESFNVISRPYMAVSNRDWIYSIRNVGKANVSNDRYVLMDSEFLDPADKLSGYHRIWDITKLRDATVCGYYLHGSGPSFFQRMVQPQSAQGFNNPALGLETFVVGRWAGGADDQAHNANSRLDWEFYSSLGAETPVSKIKGMPGCKSREMCGFDMNTTELGVGIFRMSSNAGSRYGMDNMTCNGIQCG